MTILTVLGSPRKHGKTFEIHERLAEKMLSSGNIIDLVNLSDMKVNGCLGCNACFREKIPPYCIQKDDTEMLFKMIETHDIIIYASPLYAFSFTAQMKSFLDRHYCLVTNPGTEAQSSILAGKKVVMLVTCCDPIANNADIVSVMFDRLFGRLRCTVLGKYIADRSFSDGFDERVEQISSEIAKVISYSNVLKVE